MCGGGRGVWERGWCKLVALLLLVCNVCLDRHNDKTYNKTCVTSKHSDQPVHSPNMTRIIIYPSLIS